MSMKNNDLQQAFRLSLLVLGAFPWRTPCQTVTIIYDACKATHTFNDSHPYFPESCSKCPVRGASGFTNKLKGIFVNQKKNCYNCDYAKYMIPNKEGFRVKNKYPNGGRLEIHELVETTKPDYHAIVNIAQHFAKQGCIAQVTPRVHFKSEEYRRYMVL